MEEMIALASLEADSKCGLERLTDLFQRRQSALVLNPAESIAGIGGEKPSHVFGLAQRDVLRERADEVFAERAAASSLG